MSDTITRMNPNTLPDAGKVGYSQISIVEPSRLAFVSGQVAWASDDTPVSNTLEGQTEQVVTNLNSAVGSLKATPQDIVQMRIYMTNLNDTTMGIAMGQIMGFLNGAQPSLTGVGVSELAAPGLQIEVEMIVQVSG